MFITTLAQKLFPQGPKVKELAVIDDNISDIRVNRFAFETLPVQDAVVHWDQFFPTEAASPDIKYSFAEYYDKAMQVDTFKTGDRMFYSTYTFHNKHREERVWHDDGYSGGDIYHYDRAISGKIMTSDGAFELTSDKDWKIFSKSHDSDFDGMCGIYNPWHYYYTRNSKYYFQKDCHNANTFDTPTPTFRDYAFQQSQKKANPIFKNFGQL